MEIRTLLAVLTALLFFTTPAALAGQGPAEKAPMLTINQLGKSGGPVYYIDWDGKVWKEANAKTGLQRVDVLEGVSLIRADSGDLLP